MNKVNIVGLDHLQLAMPEGKEEKARYFYGDVLGLTEVKKPPPLEGRGGCWFKGQGVVVHLGVMKDFIPATKAHPCFQVSDLAASQSFLAEAGFEIKPDDSLPEVRRCFVADPFGNRIELIQQGDVFP